MMKPLFLVILVVLLVSSFAIRASFPDTSSRAPVIYWVTDRNPARQLQVETFHRWLVEQGHVDQAGLPKVELRLDSSNDDLSKKIIQGVSGVGSDLMDVASRDLAYLAEMGILQDVTDPAVTLGFSPEHTYPAIGPEITMDGRQFGFPCNVTTELLWVNKATFAKYGQPLPPQRWTLDEFERRGKAFVAAANEPGRRQTVFFAVDIPLLILVRGQGLSIFNETLTRCTLDDPRFAQALRRKRQWITEDRILPSAKEQQTVDSASGYGGSTLQLFNRGNYGMFHMGRYALIQLRRFGQLDLAVVEPPHSGFPNSITFARTATVYVNSPHPELAHLFLAYLSSAAYNQLIVNDADALPPNPAFTAGESFLRPPRHPNEWGVHETFATAMRQIAIAGAASPFVFTGSVGRQIRQAEEAVLNGLLTPEQAGVQVATQINAEIARNLQQDPSLQPRHQQLLGQQEQIDDLRAAGKPVPSALIKNPFYRKYYQAQGWLVETAE